MNAIKTGRRSVGVGRCRVVDRGPNWLFVRVGRTDARKSRRGAADDLAAQLLEISEQHFVYRVVLEMQCVDAVDGETLRQLDLAKDRLARRGGALRLCGLREEVARAIGAARRAGLCNHSTRHGAVVGDPEE